MITVKGTNRQTGSNDPADRYKLQVDPTPSRTPYFLGAVFAALAVYLKSSLASVASVVPDGPQPGAKAPSQPDAPFTADANSQLPRSQSQSQGQPSQHPQTAQDSAENSVLATVATTVRFQSTTGLDTNVSQTIATARVNIANINAAAQDMPDVIDMAQLFGSAVDMLGAWTNESAENPSAKDVITQASDRNRAPRSARPTYLLDVVSGGVLAIALTDLLTSVSDADGDALRVSNVSVSSGSISSVEGGFIYRAAATDALGPVVVSYQVSDGKAVASLSATFSVVPNTITGTSQDDSLTGTGAHDKITGTDGRDNINALDGHDVIQGGAGDDIMYGGGGDDSVYGGAGDDVVFGGAGHDHLFGGTGNDRLLGEDGDDALMGEDGNDALLGGAGSDTLSGDAGNDTLLGGAGADTITGGDGDDALLGEDGSDTLMGGAGNDILADGAGADHVFGGSGHDLVIVAIDTAHDIYSGDAGTDTLDYSTAITAIKIDLTTGIATGLDIGSDAISGFEVVKAGSGDDYLIIGADEVVLVGGGGANVFEFVGSALAAGPPVTVHQILDFGVGDVIKTNLFDIFQKPQETAQTLFDAMQGGHQNTQDRVRIDVDRDLNAKHPVRVRYESDEDSEDTLVEWDDDAIGQVTIVKLSGHQTLICIDND